MHISSNIGHHRKKAQHYIRYSNAVYRILYNIRSLNYLSTLYPLPLLCQDIFHSCNDRHKVHHLSFQDTCRKIYFPKQIFFCRQDSFFLPKEGLLITLRSSFSVINVSVSFPHTGQNFTPSPKGVLHSEHFTALPPLSNNFLHCYNIICRLICKEGINNSLICLPLTSHLIKSTLYRHELPH